MNISYDLRHYLANQADIAAKEMTSEQAQMDITHALYYYTAVYAAIQRVLNIQFDKQLLLLLWVFEHSYQTVNNRLLAQRQGAGAPITIVPEVMSALAKAVEEFAQKVRGENDDEYTEVLEKVVAAAYATEGNGYYLLKTGVIEL